jgi:hypothetical protein
MDILGSLYSISCAGPALNCEETVPLMLDLWKAPDKRSREDWLLLKYWREVGGVLFTEVPIRRDGPRQCPPGAKSRRIDGVRIIAPKPSLPDGMYTFSRRENRRTVEDLIAGARVEVIEVKRSLDRPVIGQVIAGADLLEMEYAPAQVDPVVVCAVGDAALEAVCKRRGIAVFVSAAE